MEKGKKLVIVFIIFILTILIFSLSFDLNGKRITGDVTKAEGKGGFSGFLGKIKNLFVGEPKLDFPSSKPEFASTGYNSFKLIEETFYDDAGLDLDINKPVYSFSINANLNLKSENALVRVVLIDENNKEYLVYEAYNLIEENSVNLKNICEETCALEGIVPKELKIQIEDAKIQIKEIIYSDSKDVLSSEVKKKGVSEYNKELKKSQDEYKIKKLNSNIRKKNLGWIAGETSVSKLTYSEKKKLFGANVDEQGNIIETNKIPNLKGFEYYQSGVFDLSGAKPTNRNPKTPSTPEPSTPPTPPSNFNNAYNPPVIDSIPPAEWDWRSTHGENWMSPVKNQRSCASCWAFSAVGATEGTINVFYNQHLNIDISEQDSICRHPGSCTNGGLPGYTLSELKVGGLVDEQCMPNTATDTICNKCADSQQRLWKITTYGSLLRDDESIKRAVVEKGPVTFGVSSWWHELTLAGYYINEAGETVWILKNSWGASWGESGYVRMVVPQADRYLPYFAQEPYFAPNPNLYQISCVDKDNDGYCNWGISNSKPSTCASTCSSQKDFDDSNSSIGPMESIMSSEGALTSVCREYYPTAICSSKGETCPSGYSTLKTSTVCSGKGKSKVFYQFCIKNNNICGECSSSQELISYNYCQSGESCSLGSCI